MSTLILHIGSQKTGTTAIQGFMAANREKLSEAGVAVPLLTRQCNRQELHTGAFFEYAVKQAAYDSIGASFPSPAEQRALARSFGKLIRQPMLAVHDRWENSERLRRAASEYGSVLLSDEAIYDDMLHPDGLQAGARLFWGSVPQVLGELGFDRIKVIVYLRRQDLYLGSYWKQFVKTFDEDLALEDSYRSSSGYWSSNMDYAGKVAAIEEGLGGCGEVVVRRYGHGCLEDGDIFHDFCHAAGIPWDDAFRIEAGKANPSLSYDVCEALRAFAPLFERDGQGGYAQDVPLVSALRNEAFILSRSHPDVPGTVPLGISERAELMRPYLAGNALLARRFFGCEELFPDASPEMPREPDADFIAHCRRRFKRVLAAARLRRRIRRLFPE